MTFYNIYDWRSCIDHFLKDEADVVGIHWLIPEKYDNVTAPFFGGNFWWATVKHLRRLGPSRYKDRYDAEMWVGGFNLLPDIRAKDHKPNWPVYFEPDANT